MAPEVTLPLNTFSRVRTAEAGHNLPQSASRYRDVS